MSIDRLDQLTWMPESPEFSIVSPCGYLVDAPGEPARYDALGKRCVVIADTA
jgi:hypothetical protein